MRIEEIFKLYYKAKEDCDRYDDIDKQLFEKEFALVKKYENYPNHGAGDCVFGKMLKEIQAESAKNHKLYEKAADEYNKTRIVLLNAVTVDQNNI